MFVGYIDLLSLDIYLAAEEILCNYDKYNFRDGLQDLVMSCICLLSLDIYTWQPRKSNVTTF